MPAFAESANIAGDVASVITAVVAVLGVLIALRQLHSARSDAHAARAAELSWNIYTTYDSSELRAGRKALNAVSRDEPVPATGHEYGRTYGGDDERRGSIRRALRFYQQIGILLNQDLIDADFIFPLIGDGLETSAKGIEVAVQWHQNYYGGESGIEVASRRTIYANAVKLISQYRQWKAK